jgi:uncharacterized protein
MADYIYLLTPVLGWLAAQGLKFLFSLRKDGITVSDVWQSGGMPSSHAAFMVSLSTVVLLSEGITSILFAITAAVTAIILYDAIGVRRTVGEQVDAIRELAKNTKLKTEVHTARGHTPLEVAVGSLVGVVVGLIVFNLL